MWHKIGRGRSANFGVTDAQLLDVLKFGLPEKYGPYGLIGVSGDFHPRHGHSGNGFDERKVDDWETLRTLGVENFWIRSYTISPEEFFVNAPLNSYFGVNGFINIRGGINSRFSDYVGETFVGIVAKLNNEKTGESLHHSEYDRVFNSIKKFLRGICTTKIFHHAFPKYPICYASGEFLELLRSREICPPYKDYIVEKS